MLRKLIILWSVAAALTGCASSPAAQSRYTLTADWVDAPCRLPARFRVTLRNIGDQPFFVPTTAAPGYRQAVNFIAFTGEGQASSESFFTAPPSPDFFLRPENFVLLAPGESHGFDINFDGSLGAHGGPGRDGARWRGDFAFYYSQPAPTAGQTVPAFGPILFKDADEPVYSNRLRCP